MGDICLASRTRDASSPSNGQCRNSLLLPRRSMSIFSRKGVETPEPISSARSEAIQNPEGKQMSGKQRSWLSRSRSSSEDPPLPKHGLIKSPRGTALHAVPPASVIRLSALEEEMAQSPNDEILSAISEYAPTLRALSSPSHPSCSELQDSPSHYAPMKRTGRGGSSSGIGVWVDGVVHWNEDLIPRTDPSLTESSSTWLTASGTNSNMQKPCLSPLTLNSDTQPRAEGCTIHQPQPQRPLSLMMPTRCTVTPPLDRPTAPLRVQSPGSRVSRSSTSSSSVGVGEDASICSERSSATSIEAPIEAEGRDSYSLPGRSKASPGLARKAESIHIAKIDSGVASPHWAPPVPLRAAPCPPVNRRPVQATICLERPDELCRHENTKSSSLNADIATPTLSQAEYDLQCALTTTVKYRALDTTTGSLHRGGSVHEVMQPPSRAPTIPKRSRKREWRTRVAYPASGLQRQQSEIQQKVSVLQNIDLLQKSASVSCSSNPATTTHTASAPRLPERSTRRPVSNVYTRNKEGGELASVATAAHRRKAMPAAMMPTVAAEEVLLCILARLHSPRDLFNTAIMNKGMYRVYKENEMHLLRTVVHNESPAMWELREWCPLDTDNIGSGDMHSTLENLPLSYIRYYHCDIVVIERLKRLILERCQSFLRRETLFALSTPTHPNAPRFNDAFWRIWTFCRIFGCAKNREDDITGQMDWLKGGVLANNEDCIASTEPNMDFDMRSVLISPPSCFAEGNKGGLSAAQLVDMTEIWTCMTVLLQGYHGWVEHARFYGVYNQCDLDPGDIQRQEAMLEEWTAYLMTLGPRVVLEMAQLCPAAGFALAKDKGWSEWTVPIYNGSRTSFLKEPVAKSYEEQIVEAKQRLQDPHEQSRKYASRRRVATLAAEIRLRRQSSAFKRSPLIDMTTERAMSISSRRESVSPTRTTYSQDASRRASGTPAMSVPRTFHSITEDHVETFCHQKESTRAKDTSERAVQQLVAMGFERETAIDALRKTDGGDCLRLDRAIDLLLRQQQE